MPPKPRKVLIVEEQIVFASARSAAKHVDGDFSAVYRCLQGERKTHKGYTFEYAEELENDGE